MDPILLLSIVGLVATIVLGILGLLLQRKANDHFAERNRIMLAQGPTGEGTSSPQPTPFRPPRWPLVAMGVLVLSVWAVVGYADFDCHKRSTQSTAVPWGKQKLK